MVSILSLKGNSISSLSRNIPQDANNYYQVGTFIHDAETTKRFENAWISELEIAGFHRIWKRLLT